MLNAALRGKIVRYYAGVFLYAPEFKGADNHGGKESNAYKEISKKVFAECNRDLKHYFNVNARNNVPKKKFDEAVNYVKNWQPCTNTRIMIQDCNAQISL